MVSLSIIVPVHNGADTFATCLRSILATMFPEDELIIVADGETDGAWRLAEGTGAQVIVNRQPCGPAYARNVGARAASGEVLVFFDADVEAGPDTLRLIRDCFERDPGLSALFGSYDDTPSVNTLLSQYRNLLHHFTHQTASEEASTFFAACGAVRREVFLKAGGFDECYGLPSVEDIELGYRLTTDGHRIQLRKDVQVKHLKGWKAFQIIKTDLLLRAVPWTELILRYHKLENDLNLRFENRLSVVVVFLMAVALLISVTAVPLLLSLLMLAVALLVLNAPFYRFLWRRRGAAFTLAVIPWHWLFYFYGGLGFLFGALHYWTRRLALGKVPTYRPPVPTGTSDTHPSRVSPEPHVMIRNTNSVHARQVCVVPSGGD